MVEELTTSVDSEEEYEDKLDVLRRFKNVETLKVCLRDLNQEIDPGYVGKYLSMLGQAVLETGLRLAIEVTAKDKAERKKLQNIVILGMGKFGGSEMSYNSDLDLIFIYEGGDHETFSRLGQRVISILSTPTGEGYCYKIDLDLRPSGRSGALVTSFDSFRDYHDTSAKLWERQSLIRSFPAAGNKKLGKKVMKTIENFVYEKPLSKDFHKEIDQLRMRMENELARESKSKLNLKTGRGGLVDIEFLVQMLQLKHGSDYKSVRCQNTVEALKRLREEELITDSEYEQLSGSYSFLKKIENLLRLLHDRSISEIHENDFDHLSLEMDEYRNSDELKDIYIGKTEKVRAIYDKYFGD
jgi:glutamate-ammonia-ligase adenylyltransferase